MVCTAQPKSRVEQGGKPAAVHGAQRVHVIQTRVPLKNGLAFADFDQHKVQGFGNAGVGQLAAQQALHDFQAGFAGHLVRAGHTRASAGIQALAHDTLLGQARCQVREVDRKKVFIEGEGFTKMVFFKQARCS
jgi:hypothetical protein